MKPKRLVFFASPDFSGQILKALIKDPKTNVVALVTKPTASLLIGLANKHDIPIFKPEKLDQANLEHLKLLKPDIFLIVAYGKIFPKNWLTAPKIASLNIHFSLLPKYRGALCVSESIRNQDRQTGVTLMQMDQLLDHGPIIAQAGQKISLNDNVAALTQKLARLAVSLLPKVNDLNPNTKPQDHSRASYTPSLKSRTRQSAFIKTLENTDPKKLHALIRSLNPDPGAWTKINGQEIKILKTRLLKNKMEILTVQLPGKTPISWQAFAARFPHRPS